MQRVLWCSECIDDALRVREKKLGFWSVKFYYGNKNYCTEEFSKFYFLTGTAMRAASPQEQSQEQ